METFDFASCLKKAQNWPQENLLSPREQRELDDLLAAPDDHRHNIIDAFYRPLEFGTGGLRAVMGVGPNRISESVIRKAALALHFGLKDFLNRSPRAIVISFDSRHFSQEFAATAAQTYAHLPDGPTVYLFAELTPVPILSFAIKYLNADGGIMITASHNPPKYNGFKAYGPNGAQVIPPLDELIIGHFNQIKLNSELKTSRDQGKIISLPPDHPLLKAYYQSTLNQIIDAKLFRRAPLKIVYTPLFGSGLKPMTYLLKEIGQEVILVESQKDPDGSFPGLKGPNPEDKSAMNLAFEKMKSTKAHLAFGTDPDADRLGVWVNTFDGEVFLTGNQIGLILLHYQIKARKTLQTMPAKPVVISTIVSTPLAEKMCRKHNIEFHQTLTGFKWICNKLHQLQTDDPEKTLLFAFEESYGFLTNSQVFDKDSLNSAVLLVEVAQYYHHQGKNLLSALDEISGEYGNAFDYLLNYTLEGAAGASKIQQVMNDLRLASSHFGDNPITTFTDFQKHEHHQLPPSNVISMTLENGDTILARPSGTEPKIKFYLTLFGEKAHAQARFNIYQELIDKMINGN